MNEYSIYILIMLYIFRFSCFSHQFHAAQAQPPHHIRRHEPVPAPETQQILLLVPEAKVPRGFRRHHRIKGQKRGDGTATWSWITTRGEKLWIAGDHNASFSGTNRSNTSEYTVGV